MNLYSFYYIDVPVRGRNQLVSQVGIAITIRPSRFGLVYAFSEGNKL